MTRFWLIILRIVCIIQILIAIFECLFSFTGLVLEGEFILLLQSIASAFIAIFSIITFSISNNYFPDKIIDLPISERFHSFLFVIFILHFKIKLLAVGIIIYISAHPVMAI